MSCQISTWNCSFFSTVLVTLLVHNLVGDCSMTVICVSLWILVRMHSLMRGVSEYGTVGIIWKVPMTAYHCCSYYCNVSAPPHAPSFPAQRAWSIGCDCSRHVYKHTLLILETFFLRASLYSGWGENKFPVCNVCFVSDNASFFMSWCLTCTRYHVS